MSSEDLFESRGGGCACKGLKFVLGAAPLGVYACHCTDCQTLSGSAFGLAVVVRAAAFSVTGAPRLIPRRLGSGATVFRKVCPDCNVWVYGGSRLDLATPPELVVVRAGTFDDTSWIRPQAHYWTRSKLPWVEIYPGEQIFETQPASF